jgi:hypothetical protein
MEVPVVPWWQIVSAIVGMCGFGLSVFLAVLKWRETLPLVSLHPLTKDGLTNVGVVKHVVVEIENLSSLPILITRVENRDKETAAEFRKFLEVRESRGGGTMVSTVGLTNPFWIKAGESAKTMFSFGGEYPSKLDIQFDWRSQGTRGIWRQPMRLKRSMTEMEMLRNAISAATGPRY